MRKDFYKRGIYDSSIFLILMHHILFFFALKKFNDIRVFKNFKFFVSNNSIKNLYNIFSIIFLFLIMSDDFFFTFLIAWLFILNNNLFAIFRVVIIFAFNIISRIFVIRFRFYKLFFGGLFFNNFFNWFGQIFFYRFITFININQAFRFFVGLLNRFFDFNLFKIILV